MAVLTRTTNFLLPGREEEKEKGKREEDRGGGWEGLFSSSTANCRGTHRGRCRSPTRQILDQRVITKKHSKLGGTCSVTEEKQITRVKRVDACADILSPMKPSFLPPPLRRRFLFFFFLFFSFCPQYFDGQLPSFCEKKKQRKGK